MVYCASCTLMMQDGGLETILKLNRLTETRVSTCYVRKVLFRTFLAKNDQGYAWTDEMISKNTFLLHLHTSIAVAKSVSGCNFAAIVGVTV